MTDPEGRPVCGAETRTCGCGHHRSLHARLPGAETRRGPCSACSDCQGFVGRPHMQWVGLHPNGRCKLHGGMASKGVAHHNFQGADPLSAILPPHLRGRYVAHLEDPELLSLRRQIALAESVVTDVAGQLARKEGAPPRAQRTWGGVKDALRSGDQAALRLALDAHDRAMASAHAEQEGRAELRRQQDLLRKLKDSENDVLLKEQYVISVERALALTAAMQVIFLKGLELHVQNPAERHAVRRHVAAEYPRLVGGRGGPADGAGADVLDAAVDPAPPDQG